MTTPASSRPLTGLLGFNAGYVDTAGFLALNGLFTAHVTGNFVTLGASLIHGTSGALSKLLALPVFCVFVILARMASSSFIAQGKHPMHGLTIAKTVLLLLAAILMIAKGPFPDTNVWPAFFAGMLMVGAMAVQNGMQRIHMSSAPPSTLMTGSTTQVMIDLADLLQGVQGEAREAVMQRLRKLIPAIVTFAVGCALGALAYFYLSMWSFALPPIVSLLALFAIPRD